MYHVPDAAPLAMASVAQFASDHDIRIEPLHLIQKFLDDLIRHLIAGLYLGSEQTGIPETGKPGIGDICKTHFFAYLP